MLKDIRLSVVAVLIGWVCAIDFTINNDHQLTINSSMVRDFMSISISSRAAPNEQFWMTSPCFSDQETHKFIHAQNKMTVFPNLQDHKIIFNDYDHIEYWLTIKHFIDTQQLMKNNHTIPHFYPLQIRDQNNNYRFLMPAMSQPFTFLSITSFYRCGRAVISVQKQQNLLDLAFFTKQNEVKSVGMSGQWNWGWEENDKGIFFGRKTKNIIEDFQIVLDQSIKCIFKIQQLNERKQIPQWWSDKKEYLLSDIMENQIKALPQEQFQTNSEL